MCGIAGEVSVGSADRAAVTSMVECMVHRGPDDGNIWGDEHCVLGHRRLRIIDLSPTGSQPMRDNARGVVVVFNGEIFNFRGLREDLLELGYAFAGTSDTEVLLHGYSEWGFQLVEKLRGMFALAIWDAPEGRLLLARDRYGKKPLFYRFQAGSLSFASELNALLRGQKDRPAVCRTGFASYLRFGYVPGDSTVLEGVRRARPGEVLMWKAGQLEHKVNVGDPDLAERRPPNRDFSLVDLKATIRSAVEERLVSDVPLGCFLSGGIDSSLVVAMAREIQGPGLRTFTVSFPGTSRDEGAVARRVAGRLQTDHLQIDILSSDMEREYLDTLSRCPEPLGDDSFIPTYFISRATREHVTVALSGDGGDELFGGYPKYRQVRLGRWGHLLAGMVPRSVWPMLPDRLAKAVEVMGLADEGLRALWLSSLWKEAELSDLLLEPPLADDGRAFFLAEWEKHKASSLQERFSMTDISTYLEGSILTKVDRASMAASLEVRSPLLDERILDLTVASGVRSTPLGRRKQALKELLGGYLPLSLFAGPKRGFGLPIDEWFRGSLRGILEDYTSDQRLRDEGLLNPTAVAHMRKLHLSGQRNYGRKLHALVAWQVWRECSGI